MYIEAYLVTMSDVTGVITLKGLILCAGRGTRLYPLSYSQPKTLLPVANKPVLHYCIEKLISLGITDIGIVVNPSQIQIREYVGDGSRFQASITLIEQSKPLGIAHAVQLAESFVDSDSFIVLLGDNLLMDSLQKIYQTFQDSNASCAVMLREVDRPQDYGIAEIENGSIVSITEKPQVPKSNLAVIGAYLFTPVIFQAIHQLKPSSRGEYEITDAIRTLLEQGKEIAYTTTNQNYSDVGTMERWLSANRWMLDRQFENYGMGVDTIVENCQINPPVIIGSNCTLRNSKIGPYVSIQDGATVTNCKEITNSILLEDTSLTGIDWVIKDSVFGRSSQIIGTPSNESGVLIVSDKSYISIPIRKGDPANEC